MESAGRRARAKELFTRFSATLAALVLTGGCAHVGEPGGPSAKAASGRQAAAKMPLSSPAFANGAPIPARYTCDGDNISPPLQWNRVPRNARSLTLICEDLDAPSGIWVHWVLFNVPPGITELPAEVPTTATVLDRAKQGTNDFKHIGYGGPCPPPGKSHRYFFKLYALDTILPLKAGATNADVTRTMQGHLLAQGQLMGTYQRK